jgi:hypothetical protein
LGRVTDTNGLGISDAFVYASGPGSGYAYTDTSGYYSIIGLAAGEYIVTVYPPYGTNLASVSTTAMVALGETTTLDFVLPEKGIISGLAGEVNCDILPFAYVELRQGATVIDSTTSDAAGNYMLEAFAPGTYDLIIDKDGWRSQTQQVTISSPGIVTMDFIGQTGLVPNAPSIQYVAQCSNHYLYPYGNCGLTVQRVAAVSNAYLYPVSE